MQVSDEVYEGWESAGKPSSERTQCVKLSEKREEVKKGGEKKKRGQ